MLKCVLFSCICSYVDDAYVFERSALISNSSFIHSCLVNLSRNMELYIIHFILA